MEMILTEDSLVVGGWYKLKRINEYIIDESK